MNISRLMLFFFLILAGCGAPVEPEKPPLISEKLRAQIERIEPLLAYTCDSRLPAEYSGIPCSREGDGVSMLGWTLLYGGMGQWSGIRDSIGLDGRPWRNPARVENDDNNSFSRDQMLGLLEGTIASGDIAPLRSVLKYVEATGRLCPGDDRCNITGSLLELWTLVLGKSVSVSEKLANEWTIQAEASTVPPGYQVHLVMRKILLYAKLGKLTTAHQKASKALLRRFPKSLFVRATDLVVNGGDPNPLAEDLISCMAQWEGSGNHWIGTEIELGCQKFSYGHEYVSLAKYMLSGAKGMLP